MQDIDLDRRMWNGPLGTLDSIIRAQRRIKGVIVSMEPSNMRIASEYGEFPFNEPSIKENKKFPDRPTQKGDRCEFKVSDTNPPRATSIRVMIPKKELTVGGNLSVGDEDERSFSSFGTSCPTSLSGFDDLVNVLKNTVPRSLDSAVSTSVPGSQQGDLFAEH